MMVQKGGQVTKTLIHELTGLIEYIDCFIRVYQFSVIFQNIKDIYYKRNYNS